MQTEEVDLCLEFGVSSMRRRMETKFLRSVYFWRCSYGSSCRSCGDKGGRNACGVEVDIVSLVGTLVCLEQCQMIK
jgi:hypothetical protein